jgi:hypothetical protein
MSDLCSKSGTFVKSATCSHSVGYDDAPLKYMDTIFAMFFNP